MHVYEWEKGGEICVCIFSNINTIWCCVLSEFQSLFPIDILICTLRSGSQSIYWLSDFWARFLNIYFALNIRTRVPFVTSLLLFQMRLMERETLCLFWRWALSSLLLVKRIFRKLVDHMFHDAVLDYVFFVPFMVASLIKNHYCEEFITKCSISGFWYEVSFAVCWIFRPWLVGSNFQGDYC